MLVQSLLRLALAASGNSKRLAALQGALDVCNMRQQAALTALATRSADDATSILHKIDDDEKQISQLQSELLRQCSADATGGTSTSLTVDLLGSVLEGRRLGMVDLSVARLSSSFNRADVAHSIFDGALLSKCTFHLAVVSYASAVDTRFFSCTFMGADMRHVDGRLARFSNCTFHRCDMSDWKADGAVFVGCEFHRCSLGRWSYSGQTTFLNQRGLETCDRDGWRQSDTSVKKFGVQDYQQS